MRIQKQEKTLPLERMAERESLRIWEKKGRTLEQTHGRLKVD